jgi:outer membrane protein assembly factor BamB
LAAWDLYTGKLAWETELDYPWGFAGAYAVASAYGLVYRFSYAGVYALDWNSGKIIWRYATPTNPYESAYADPVLGTLSPFDTGAQIADGTIFVANSEHSATQPIMRGWKLHAINATTGEGIWNITGSWGTPGPVADGYLFASDAYTGYMYVFGKGKSATTVSAPDIVVPKGSSVVIKGTVLDMSPAQLGTPAVSKESMTTQMEYLNLQIPIGGVWGNATITGVPVTLTAIGSDETLIDIGTVTTNGYYGTFSKSWIPPAEGDYEIIASFAGDDSYGSSGASTSVSVSPAPEPTQVPEQVAPPDYTLTIIGSAVAIIIAVAIAVLILRKR